MSYIINNTVLVVEVTEMIQQIARIGNGAVTAQSDVLVEMDFDSLQLLELTTMIKERYGVDFLELPSGLRELKNAETIAVALERERGKANAA